MRFLYMLALLLLATAARADAPLEQLVARLDGALAAVARGAPAAELAPLVQALRPAAQGLAASPDPTTQELVKQLAARHLRPASFEVTRGDRLDRARLTGELTAARDLARLALAPPPLDGRLDITLGNQQYHVDFKQMYAASRAQALHSGGAAHPAHQATDTEVDQLIAGYSPGAVAWAPAVRRWFHFEYRATTPEDVAGRVAGLMDRYLARPENLAELGPRIGLPNTRTVRVAAFVLRTLRRFGVDIRLPGGSDAAQADARDEIRGLLIDLGEVFPMLWGQLRTAISFSANQGPGTDLVRDTFRSFANPVAVAARAGLLLNPDQEARLKTALFAQADSLAADLNFFYDYRQKHGANESLPAFVSALMDDLTAPLGI